MGNRELESAIVGLLEELVAVESIAQKPENLRRVVEISRRYLEGKPWKFWAYERNGKPSLICTTRDTKSPEIFFVGHLDVVDADPEQFQLRRNGDRLWGRGTADMKGACAVMLQLFRDLPEDKPPDVGLMLTTDEEVGSPDGVAYLLREEGWSAKFAVIPDGGGDFSLVLAEKGALHLRIRAEGRAAHGSQPWAGENALDRVLGLYRRLRESGLFPEEPCGDPEHWHPTLNLGRLQGGRKVNIVADRAEMELDIRFPEPWTVKKMRQKVQDFVQEDGLEMEILTTGEVVYTDPENPYVRRYVAAVRRVLQTEPAFRKEHGATDGRFFAEKGIPIVITGPEGGGIHGPEEWVSAGSLLRLYEVFRVFLGLS